MVYYETDKEYYCNDCWGRHQKTSRIGKQHYKHRLNDNILMALKLKPSWEREREKKMKPKIYSKEFELIIIGDSENYPFNEIAKEIHKKINRNKSVYITIKDKYKRTPLNIKIFDSDTGIKEYEPLLEHRKSKVK